MRDVETARIGVQSALTGHFVLSSLHATDAAGALDRFLDMGIEPFLVASSVIGVVGQRLVRRICRYCSVPYEPPVEELAFYRRIGRSREAGVLARRGLQLLPPHRLRGPDRRLRAAARHGRDEGALISQKARHDEIQELAVEQGMRTLRDSGIQLVADDMTTISEVLRNIYMI